MTLRIVLAALLFAPCVLGILPSGARAKAPQSQEEATQMYLGLRELALTTRTDDIGLEPGDRTEPYGVVMDMDMRGGTVTIVAFASGDASIYLSTGGGIIGSGQESAQVAEAAQQFVMAAAEHVAALPQATDYPLPDRDEVRFFIITESGVYSGNANGEELVNGHDPLSPLFAAGQEVLTQIRLLRERQEAAGQ